MLVTQMFPVVRRLVNMSQETWTTLRTIGISSSYTNDE